MGGSSRQSQRWLAHRWANCSQRLMARGRLLEAEAAISRSLAVCPAVASFWVALASVRSRLMRPDAALAAYQTAERLDPELPLVVVNEGQFRQVFLGLASNALEAMDGRGRLTIRTRRARTDVHVEFADEGPGITDDVLARIFDPFFTTKPPGQGTGLGLAIAQSIVADHAGRIEVDSRLAIGTVFRVVLPA